MSWRDRVLEGLARACDVGGAAREDRRSRAETAAVAAAEGVAAELTLVGGWDGLSAVEWAKRALAALHALGGQAWERWQLVIEAELAVADATAAELSGAYLNRRGGVWAERLFRETLPFDQRAYLIEGERGVEPKLLASSLRAADRAAERAAGGKAFFYGAAGSAAAARHEIISDVALAAEPAAVLHEQGYARRAGGTADLATAANGAAATTSDRSSPPPPPPSASGVLQMSWSEVLGLGGARALVGRGVHLYVFVHGFHGNSFDLRGMRNQLALLHPDKASARYLLSSCNEDHTASASFETLGANLAREVLAFIDQEGISTTLARLSFVGHSFGAVICRAALAHELLKPLWPKLHTYISLSGPHLGMLYGSNTLVEIGIWGIRKWNKKARALPHTALLVAHRRLPRLRPFPSRRAASPSSR